MDKQNKKYEIQLYLLNKVKNGVTIARYQKLIYTVLQESVRMLHWNFLML